MKINIDFSHFDKLMRQMGASEVEWKPVGKQLDPRAELIRELEDAGIELPSLDQINDRGGLLEYAGEQIILYIKDTRKDIFFLEESVTNRPRFHVAECRTLREMRRNHRGERYVATTKKTGLFEIEGYKDQSRRDTQVIEAQLHVCKNCLRKLNWHSYADQSSDDRDEIVEQFDIGDFLASYSTFFSQRPEHTDKSAPVGAYVEDWYQISRSYRASRNWECEKCGVKLESNKSLLHTHHKNGVVSNNAPSNLESLCVLCHSEEPLHGRLKSLAKKCQTMIEKLRLIQGI